MEGTTRGMLYRFATMTGLRAAELASLTPASFDLAADTPTVTLEAGYQVIDGDWLVVLQA